MHNDVPKVGAKLSVGTPMGEVGNSGTTFTPHLHIVFGFTDQNDRYRVFINYCVFSLNFFDFLNSASSAAMLVFYLPVVCTHNDTKSLEYSKIFGEKYNI